MLSDVMEDYLKAIYTLQLEHGPPVSTSDIAEYLGKTPPTVTSMVGKLEDRGLLDREKYKGVELTGEGQTVALEVLRHHRLLEAYLTEHLDYSWSEVHDEADALEHHISEEFERRVAAALGEPKVDPHGDPIPSADLTPPDSSGMTALVDHEVGDQLVVCRVSDRDPEELEYLSEAGVTPGTTIEITDIAPFGMVTVRVLDSDREQSLPEAVAQTIRVRPPDESCDGEGVSPA
ncbi:metal-dependent transcriptional regulator [Haloferax mediterranei ATCC 33500]|uniref:DtxR family transcriptional regulator n=1 Tax=Haloferax mediterranei (strain ATCC 33500 / DSM 1411 / JCM 8866 / NBRC 14739 / NCIMB 2177 / R-4) TaxID=523841 RepID=I3R2Q1_HALMT|nr:metal-dependent transcriptional regulator [Haloferax mediterranei]AFK18511.1 transcription regulator sirR [Haloferax mediterranei ATCC 33500]AHZ22109.1 DtxR family transcriptional regulator [Haloferax mediterranei ATCC 33500]EMA02216.1 transcription regulator sirR [Haloferax mediterranei ATCC 33500]MDX5988599.1 metal-dependent transcriptional regulator [Haloferax mediterranei ATCC 33500]QCQ75015.1 metal-dependent transcriptional regulator [Haloferax mediterranei ATCC 33500]